MNNWLREMRYRWEEFSSSFKRGLQSAGLSIGSFFGGIGWGLRSLPRGVAGFTHAILEFFRSIGRGIGELFFQVKSAPENLRRTGQSMSAGLKRGQSGLADSIKGVQVQVKQQPDQVRKGLGGRIRGVGMAYMRRSLWVRIAIPVLVLALTGGILAAPVGYRAIKSWRSDQMLEQALEFESQGDLRAAFDRAKAAYNLDPRSSDAIRVRARLARELDDPNLLQFSRQLAETSPGNRDDLLLFVESALDRRNFDITLPYIERLKEDFANDPRVANAEIRLLLANQRTSEAIERARQLVVEQGVDNPQTHLFYALLLINSQRETLQQEALNYLRDAAVRDDEIGIQAIGLLLSTTGIELDERVRLIERARTHPEVNRDILLLTHQIELDNGLSTFAESQDLIFSLFDLSSQEDLVTLSAWLLDTMDLPGAVVELLDDRDIEDSTELVFNLFQAQIRSGQAQQVLERLTTPADLPLSEIERYVLQAQGQKELGRMEAYRSTVALAVSRAEMGEIGFLQRALNELEERDAMLDLAQRLARDPIYADPGRAMLLELAFNFRREEIIRSVLPEVQASDYPEQPRLQGLIVYLKTLLGVNVNQQRRIAEELVANYPEATSLRLALAFTYYESGYSPAAFQIIDSLEAPRISEGDIDRWRLVTSAVLSGLNRPQEARTVLDNIQEEALLPAEREMLADIRAVLAANTTSPSSGS